MIDAGSKTVGMFKRDPIGASVYALMGVIPGMGIMSPSAREGIVRKFSPRFRLPLSDSHRGLLLTAVAHSFPQRSAPYALPVNRPLHQNELNQLAARLPIQTQAQSTQLRAALDAAFNHSVMQAHLSRQGLSQEQVARLRLNALATAQNAHTRSFNPALLRRPNHAARIEQARGQVRNAFLENARRRAGNTTRDNVNASATLGFMRRPAPIKPAGKAVPRR